MTQEQQVLYGTWSGSEKFNFCIFFKTSYGFCQPERDKKILNSGNYQYQLSKLSRIFFEIKYNLSFIKPTEVDLNAP